MAQDWKKMEMYKKAHQLVLEIYAVAKKLPDGEQEYGIGAEICQNAMQIPATSDMRRKFSFLSFTVM